MCFEGGGLQHVKVYTPGQSSRSAESDPRATRVCLETRAHLFLRAFRAVELHCSVKKCQPMPAVFASVLQLVYSPADKGQQADGV